MNTVTLNTINMFAASDLETDLSRARILVNWMDAKFSVAGVRFGLDGIVGLIPVVGDTLTAAAALYPIYVAHKHDLGKDVIARMGVNVAIDYVGGLIPLLGDLVDVAFKANLKNAALLETAARRKR
jgi:hypothetical protein